MIHFTDNIRRKLNLLFAMKMKNINDFVPLLEMKEERLRHFSGIDAKEEQNRIYYYSEKMKVSKLLS